LSLAGGDLAGRDGTADDLALLTAAAAEAGRIALGYFRRDPERWDKGGGAGPVSEADLAADRMLREALTAARPDYGWLSEETPDDRARLDCERVFVVDPIDGTRAFLAGEEGWCVATAVVERGAPVAAAVVFPAMDTVYAAAFGAGATRDGAPIRASAREGLGGGVAYASENALKAARWPGGAPPMRRSFKPAMIHRLCLVAEGAGEATISFGRVWDWDAAPGALIAAEAGCAVTDAEGRKLTFNAADPRAAGLIAAPASLHADLIARRGGAAGG
jgi:myo-inositol-1(or 4)-monophosphatase